MRGAPRWNYPVGVTLRIIPAYAGSSFIEFCQSRIDWDHPRVCGEQNGIVDTTNSVTGSSPRMRGADHDTVVDRLVAGIIPAYAGSSFWYRASSCIAWDHPRVCGEQDGLPQITPTLLGSSPRMRGAELRRLKTLSDLGIIPAYAGSSPRVTNYLDIGKDHPRVCGEQHRCAGLSRR